MATTRGGLVKGPQRLASEAARAAKTSSSSTTTKTSPTSSASQKSQASGGATWSEKIVNVSQLTPSTQQSLVSKGYTIVGGAAYKDYKPSTTTTISKSTSTSTTTIPTPSLTLEQAQQQVAANIYSMATPVQKAGLAEKGITSGSTLLEVATTGKTSTPSIVKQTVEVKEPTLATITAGSITPSLIAPKMTLAETQQQKEQAILKERQLEFERTQELADISKGLGSKYDLVYRDGKLAATMKFGNRNAYFDLTEREANLLRQQRPDITPKVETVSKVMQVGKELAEKTSGIPVGKVEWGGEIVTKPEVGRPTILSSGNRLIQSGGMGIIGPGEWKPVMYEEVINKPQVQATQLTATQLKEYGIMSKTGIKSPDQYLKEQTDYLLAQKAKLPQPEMVDWGGVKVVKPEVGRPTILPSGNKLVQSSGMGIIGPGEWKPVMYEEVVRQPEKQATQLTKEQLSAYNITTKTGIQTPDQFLKQQTEMLLGAKAKLPQPEMVDWGGVKVVKPSPGRPTTLPSGNKLVMSQPMGIIGPGEWKPVMYEEIITQPQKVTATVGIEPGVITTPFGKMSMAPVTVKSPADVFAPYVEKGKQQLMEAQPVKAVLGVKPQEAEWFYDIKGTQRDIVDMNKLIQGEQQKRAQGYELIVEKQQTLAKDRDAIITKYNTELNEAIIPWSKTLEQKGKTLETQAIGLSSAKIDLTDEKAVSSYNKDVEKYMKEKERYDTDKLLFEQRIKELDKSLEPLDKYEQDLAKLDEQRLTKLKEYYKVSEEGAKAIERLKSRDIFYVKEKKAEAGRKGFREDYTWKESPIQRFYGEELGFVEMAGLGIAETARNIPEFLIASPLREAERTGKQAREQKLSFQEQIPLFMQSITPGRQQIAGIYNPYDIENVKYRKTDVPKSITEGGIWKIPSNLYKKTGLYQESININPKALSGGISTAVIAAGGIAGATTGGVVLPAKTTGTTLLGTIGKIALPSIVTTAVVAPPVVGVYQTEKAVKNVDVQLQNLEAQKENISPKEYELTKTSLENQKQIIRNQGMTVDRAFGQIGKTTGEIAAVSALSIGAVKIGSQFAPKYTTTKITTPFSYKRQITSKGGELGGGETIKGVKIPETPLPKASPKYARTDILMYQEKPAGIWNTLTGKKIDTTVSLTPSYSTTGGGYDITRVRQFGDLSYVTTQAAGQPYATTKILDQSGKVIRTLQETPMTFGTGVGTVPYFETERSLYPRIAKQIDKSTIYQKVGKARAEKFEYPLDKDYKIVGEVKYTTEAEKLSRAPKTTISKREIPQAEYYEYYMKTPEREGGRLLSIENVGEPTPWVVTTKKTPLAIGDERVSRLTQVTTQTTRTSPPAEQWLGKSTTPSGLPAKPVTMETTLYNRGLVKNVMGTDVKGVITYRIVPIESSASFSEKYIQPITQKLSGLGQTISDSRILDTKSWGKRASTGIGMPSQQTIIESPSAVVVKGPKSDSLLSLERAAQKSVVTGQEYTSMLKTVPKVAPLAFTTQSLSGVGTIAKIAPTVASTTTILSLTPSTIEMLAKPQLLQKSETLQLYTQRQKLGTVSKVSAITATTPEIKPATLQKTEVTPIVIPDVVTRTITSQTGRIAPKLTPLAALAGVGLLSAIPSIKIPTFGAFGGGLLGGEGRYTSSRRGVQSWLISNPIAQYGEEWFARQQMKQLLTEQARKQEPTMRDVAERAVTKGFGGVKQLTSERAGMITGTSKKKKAKRWI